MSIKIWIGILSVIVLSQGLAMNHQVVFKDDTYMNEHIDEAIGIIRDPKKLAAGQDIFIWMRRCPYDDMSFDFKYQLIERSFQRGFYSQRIRDRLREVHLYPLLSVDRDNQTYVHCVCRF